MKVGRLRLRLLLCAEKNKLDTTKFSSFSEEDDLAGELVSWGDTTMEKLFSTETISQLFHFETSTHSHTTEPTLCQCVYVFPAPKSLIEACWIRK